MAHFQGSIDVAIRDGPHKLFVFYKFGPAEYILLHVSITHWLPWQLKDTNAATWNTIRKKTNAKSLSGMVLESTWCSIACPSINVLVPCQSAVK